MGASDGPERGAGGFGGGAIGLGGLFGGFKAGLAGLDGCGVGPAGLATAEDETPIVVGEGGVQVAGINAAGELLLQLGQITVEALLGGLDCDGAI